MKLGSNLLTLMLALLPLVLCQAVQVASDRPNVVLIMCDDMGWSDVGSYGSEISTPNIDRLAAEGLRFTQFYNCAKCTTTRAAILTGLHPRRGKRALLGSDMVTIAEVMKTAGYQTGMSGKWHLGSTAPGRPIDRGFDEYYGLMDGACNYFNPTQPDPDFKGNQVRKFGHNDQLITEFPDDFYTTDAFSDHAVKTIHRFATNGVPFFIHVTYNAPHYPLHAWPEDIAKYQGTYLPGWTALREQRHRRQIELGLIDPEWTLPGQDPEVEEWESQENKKWQDLRMAVYAAMIDRMDQGIGNILRALDDTGTADNTIVMFLSDNGGCSEHYGQDTPDFSPGPKENYTTCGPSWAYAQNTPFRRYKTWMHEGGISTPFIVRWPGKIEANSMTDQVGHIIDVLPTIAEVGRADYPSEFAGRQVIPVEGISLVPVFEGGHRAGHETLWWEFAGNRAVREGDWKLCWDKKVKTWELYNMIDDRTETRDLANSFPDRVERMSNSWIDWARKTGVLE
jgi:arylsulfatase A-like enzyme